MYKHKVYNKNNNPIINNEYILNNLLKLDYKSIGYTSDFEKYDVIIENNNGYHDIYHNFNRNTKRNIAEGLNYGITLKKGTMNDLEEVYKIFKKKTPNRLAYYENLMNIYRNPDNKMEIFFAGSYPCRNFRKRQVKFHAFFKRFPVFFAIYEKLRLSYYSVRSAES